VLPAHPQFARKCGSRQLVRIAPCLERLAAQRASERECGSRHGNFLTTPLLTSQPIVRNGLSASRTWACVCLTKGAFMARRKREGQARNLPSSACSSQTRDDSPF